MAQYWYGVKNGIAISIEDIPESMKGLACECVCPKCKRRFEACALGETHKRERYFRHQKDLKPEGDHVILSDCNVDWANESGLHLMAKQILQNCKCIMLPALIISPVECDLPDEIACEIPQDDYYCYSYPGIYSGSSAELEPLVGGFKPDVRLKEGYNELFVEIKVSHGVDEEKLKKVQAYAQTPMIEIDLQFFSARPVDQATLSDFLCKSTEFRKWCFHPSHENAVAKATEYYKKCPIVYNYYRKIAQRERGKKKMLHLFSHADAYTAEIRCLRCSDQVLQQFFQQKPRSVFWFWHETHTLPFFVNIPIVGEMIFQCDRRIWQSIVFNRYIFNRKNIGEHEIKICIDNVFHDLQENYRIPIDWELTYKQEIGNRTFSLAWDVIAQYFDHLEFLGFISYNRKEHWHSQKWATVLCTHTITPPNTKAVEFLKKALQEANQSNPFVGSDLIRAEYDFREKERAERLAQKKRQRDEAEQAECIQKETEVQALREEISMLAPSIFSVQAPLVCSDNIPRYQCEDCKEIMMVKDLFVYDKDGRRGLCKNCTLKRNENRVQKRLAFEQKLAAANTDPNSIFSVKRPLLSVNGSRVFQCKICSLVANAQLFANHTEGDDQNRVCLSCWNVYKRNEVKLAAEEPDAQKIAREILAGRASNKVQPQLLPKAFHDSQMPMFDKDINQ